MERINIAELLKNCSEGMELDCTMYNSVSLLRVNDKEEDFPIIVIRDDGHSITLTKYGQYTKADFAKCVIYPKGKTTWEGFVPPCKYKEGDVLYIDCTDDEDFKQYNYIFILNKISNGMVFSYCHYSISNDELQISNPEVALTWDKYPMRLATTEEKQKLFNAIKDKGYKWNEKTKTLEKLPRFKVGNRVKKGEKIATIVRIYKNCYDVRYDNGIGSFTIDLQDEWELIPNKFDITTLKPFDEVLVRCSDGGYWQPQFFSNLNLKNSNFPFVCTYNSWKQCIPYEGNEHLINTTKSCDDFYKTW